MAKRKKTFSEVLNSIVSPADLRKAAAKKAAQTSALLEFDPDTGQFSGPFAEGLTPEPAAELVMERTWTTAGVLHTESPEQREAIAGMIDRLEWLSIADGLTMSMMAGLGIEAAIKELKIPKVSHVATSNEMAPYGLYGIRGHFSNGRADVFLCDEGSRMVVLASDHYPNESEGAK